EADPVAAKYIRPFVAGSELITNKKRWCLWLEDMEPGDDGKAQELKSRLDAVRKMRSQAKQAATYKAAATPHLFVSIRQPRATYLAIPIHVSESRRYYLADRFGPEVICSNANFAVPDEDGILFALITSSMFISWQRTVGGTLESRLRFSNTVVWNNFPVPELSEQDRVGIIDGGKAVLEARAKFPNRSLADHYQPLAMDPDLLKAHDKLDRAVDKAFGAPRKLNNEKHRQELLFQNYVKLTQ